MEFQLVRPIRVLYVADTDTNFPHIALPLLHAGYALATAADQTAALDSIRAHSWNAVLIDCGDTDASLALVKAIHEQAADLPVIVIAPLQPAGVIERGFAAGAYDWLQQPIEATLLDAALQRAAERRHLLRQRKAAGPYQEDVRHKINNHLSSIIGLAQLHELDDTLPHELIQDLDVIIQSAREIRDLLRQDEAE